MTDRRQLLKGLAAAGGVALLPRVMRAAVRPRCRNSRSSWACPRALPPADRWCCGRASRRSRINPMAACRRGLAAALRSGRGRKLPPHREARRCDRPRPRFAHSVHQEVKGLRAGARLLVSLHGRRSCERGGPHAHLPAPRAQVERLRIAVACCQNYEHGHFAALRYLAAEAPDMVLHLGDYIYEGAPAARRVRRHTGGAAASRWRTIAGATRCTRAIRRCRPRMPPHHGSSPGTTTTSPMTTPARSRAAQEDAAFLRAPRRRVPGLVRAPARAALDGAARRRDAHLLARATGPPRHAAPAGSAPVPLRPKPVRGRRNWAACAWARTAPTSPIRRARCWAAHRSSGCDDGLQK